MNIVLGKYFLYLLMRGKNLPSSNGKNFVFHECKFHWDLKPLFEDGKSGGHLILTEFSILCTFWPILFVVSPIMEFFFIASLSLISTVYYPSKWLLVFTTFYLQELRLDLSLWAFIIFKELHLEKERDTALITKEIHFETTTRNYDNSFYFLYLLEGTCSLFHVFWNAYKAYQKY